MQVPFEQTVENGNSGKGKQNFFHHISHPSFVFWKKRGKFLVPSEWNSFGLDIFLTPFRSLIFSRE
jgi:hypothetical protein